MQQCPVFLTLFSFPLSDWLPLPSLWERQVHFVHDPAKGPFPRDEKEMVINETDPAKASTRACWEGLEQLVKDGLVRDIGVSNFSEAQVRLPHSFFASSLASPYIAHSRFSIWIDALDMCLRVWMRHAT